MTPPPNEPTSVPPAARSSTTWTSIIRVIFPSVVLVTLSFAIAWHFVRPAPPSRVVIATGGEGGMYYSFAKEYARYFAPNGIELVVRPTAGSVENYRLLMDPDCDVELAIVQGGSAPVDAKRSVEALAGVYYEPVMVFYRGDQRVTQVSQLDGKRIAVGGQGSGVRLLATDLLGEAGVTDGDKAGTKLSDQGGDVAGDALVHGDVDAAVLVIAPTAPIVARLLATPGVRLMSFDHARAYGRRRNYLSPVTLYQGSVDVRRNLPETDVQLVASPATLVMRAGTHQAIVELMIEAAQHFHSAGTLLSDAGAFPSDGKSELHQNTDAHYFLTNKPSFLRRTFPFWLASMINRLLILLLPLLVVLVPLTRLVPPLMKWTTQRRILVWYQRIGEIDKQLTPRTEEGELRKAHLKTIDIENEVAKVRVPLSYSEELYNLRVHVAFVRDRIDRLLRGATEQADGSGPAVDR